MKTEKIAKKYCKRKAEAAHNRDGTRFQKIGPTAIMKSNVSMLANRMAEHMQKPSAKTWVALKVSGW